MPTDYKLFIKYGSDKSLAHDYHLPYAELLDTCSEGPLCEMGIGSKNRIFPAAMIIYGTPGGGLRAWKNINIFTNIYGADIGEEVLFSEDGITTHVVDQLDASSLNNFANYLLDKEPLGFSLIIDDGFHNFTANINSLRALRHLVKPEGCYVVEDMNESIFHSFLSVISEFTWKVWLNRGQKARSYLLVLKRR